MIKSLPIQLPESKKVKIEYKIALAKIEQSTLSNSGKNLISCTLTKKYKIVLLEIILDRMSIVAKRSQIGPGSTAAL